jgi:sortase A
LQYDHNRLFMTQKVTERGQSSPERRRFGVGAVLGIVLVIAGATLLLMVFMIMRLGSSWRPVPAYGTESGVLPPLVTRSALAPALAPAPTEEVVVLPTPLPGDYFASAATAPQSGFVDPRQPDSVALLPESPADPGSANGRGATDGVSAQAADDSTRLEIGAIGLDAPIQTVGLMELEDDGQTYHQWQVPSDYAIGWHVTSAAPGSQGNTVLNGHNNVHGAVFRDLVELALGDEITLYENGQTHHYLVAHREVLEEKGQPLDVRFDNAKWMLPTADERLTLITCWPDTGATHRVIVVATPVEGG